MSIKDYQFTDYSLDLVEANEIAISFNTRDIPWIAIYPADVIEMSKHFNQSKYLKQHDLALLNSLKTEFINSNQSCEAILESRIVNLELDNDNNSI